MMYLDAKSDKMPKSTHKATQHTVCANQDAMLVMDAATTRLRVMMKLSV